MATAGASGIIRFGAFEFDSSQHELRKGGTRLKVPDQSLTILAMLLEHPGELVTRDTIQARLWPNGTVVEFEHSVNSAVKRLREALLDTAATPRFVETLPRKGYRFVGTLAPMDGGRPELAPGTVLSHYRILAEAGRGAMGVVYKAEDTTLQRMVALKFLPEELVTHQPALERLRREARMIGALNHPGICTVYELGDASGRMFLVMEFLEGESLRARMARGPLTRDEFFDIAVQVARALEAAHGQGMVHRDIKPDNVFLTKQGAVKLLDFGLAKLVEEEGGAAPQSSVTGTSGYMSPEQARGEALDARADIYSLGCVLVELAGETPPKRLAPILKKALASDPANRWQSAGELRTALERVRRRGWPRRALVAGLAASIVAAAVLVVWFRGAWTREDLRPVPLVALSGLAAGPSLSPDGHRVVFVWRAPNEYSHSGADDKCGLYVADVGGGPPVRLTSDESDVNPAWSPDDRNIAFIRGFGQDGALLLIPAIGGPPRELAKVGERVGYTIMSWTPDARWLVLSARESEHESFGIWMVSAETGERRRLLPPPGGPVASEPIRGDFAGPLSPDGRMLVFTRSLGSNNSRLYAVRLTADLRPEGPPRELSAQAYPFVIGMAWAGEREIIFGVTGMATGGLYRMSVAGGPPAQRLNWAPNFAASPAVAPSHHRLVYAQYHESQNLWRMDLRTGECKMILASVSLQSSPQYSPDGRRITFQSNRSGTDGVWTCDAGGGNCQQLNAFPKGIGGTPRWSPDGRWLAFESREEGKSQIYVIPSSGGPQRRLTSGTVDSMTPSWSRDGRWIYFVSDRSGKWRVWKAPVGGGEAVQVTHTAGGDAFESADGKSLYFRSLEKHDSSLFRVPVGGGEEKPVAPHVSGGGSFGVTARGVYFLSDPKTLQLLDAKTGLIRTVARLERNSADSGMTVSADDASLLFAQSDERSDLMLVEGFR